jgi:hypothetical protein
VICLHFWSTNLTPSGEGRWSTESPDGRFIVTGYSNKGLRAWIPTMPGNSGYGPGIIILRDKKTGEILQQAEVKNLGNMGAGNVNWMVGDPDAPWRKGWASFAKRKDPWEGDYVSIKLANVDLELVTWPLPSLDGKLPSPRPEVTIISP